MMISLPHGLAVLASAALLLDTVAPVSGSLVDAAGRLSLDGVLVAGVIALWKALAAREAAHAEALAAKDQRIDAKDAQIITMTTKVTEVMALVLEAVKELRSSVNRLCDDDGLGQEARLKSGPHR